MTNHTFNWYKAYSDFIQVCSNEDSKWIDKFAEWLAEEILITKDCLAPNQRINLYLEE